jgi:hypothetical protein
MLIAKSEWARQKGFSRPYVSQLIRLGHVIPVDGQIDTDQAEAALAAMYDPNKPRKTQLPYDQDRTSKMSNEVYEPIQSRKTQSSTDLSTFLLKTRIKNEVEKGKLLEVEAKVKTGQYVDAKEVEKQAFQVARTVRDSLQNIPDRVSSLLASISDANQIYEVLSKEIRRYRDRHKTSIFSNKQRQD